MTFALWLPAGDAGADEGLRVSIQWQRFADALQDWSPLRFEESWVQATPGKAHLFSAARPVGFHISPQLSVVARDWGGAQPIVGRLTLTDRMRLSRSSRIVITRLRLAEGAMVPFAQAGVGQWRVDTALLPVMPSDIEPAAVFGAGFEFCMDQNAAMGLEADYTILYREQHEPQMVSAPHLWGTYFAARVGF